MTLQHGRMAAANSNTPTAPAAQPQSEGPWFDQGWILYRAIHTRPGDDTGRAEDALLTWLLRLDDAHDPAEAAERALRVYRHPAQDGGSVEAQRLTALLDETRRYPRGRLAHLPVRRRTRARTARS